MKYITLLISVVYLVGAVMVALDRIVIDKISLMFAYLLISILWLLVYKLEQNVRL